MTTPCLLSPFLTVLVARLYLDLHRACSTSCR